MRFASTLLKKRHPLRRIAAPLVLLLVCAFLAALAARAAQPTPAINQDVIEEFRFDPNCGLLTVPVTLEGRTFTFALDTSSVYSIFDVSLRSLLGKPRRSASIFSEFLGGMGRGEVFVAPKAFVGRLPIEDLGVVECADLSQAKEICGRPIDGLIGCSWLKHRVVQIDFEAGVIRFLRSAGKEHTSAIRITHPSVLFLSLPDPAVEVELPGENRVLFEIDTSPRGDHGTLENDLFDRLTRTHHLALLGRTLPEAVGAKDATAYGELDRVTLGTIHDRDLTFSRGRANRLGLRYWSRFVVTIDFPHDKLYLRSGRRLTAVEPRDVSGLHLRRMGDVTRVEFIDDGSPAQRAGIERNDNLVSVDGNAAAAADLVELRRKLSKPSGSVKLTVSRRDRCIEAPLELVEWRPGEARRADPDGNVLEEFTVDREGGLLLVPVTVAGRTYSFALMPGCPCCVYDSSLRSTLNPRSIKRTTLTDGKRIELIRPPEAALGALPLRCGSTAVMLDLGVLRAQSGQEVYGMLGIDALARYVVRIDLDAGKATFLRAAGNDGGREVRIVHQRSSWFGHDALPAVEVEFGGRRRVTANIGFMPMPVDGTLEAGLLDRLVGTEAASRFGEARSIFDTPSKNLQVVKVRAISIGGVEHRERAFMEGKNELGLGHWSRYVATFDFPNDTLYLKPGRLFDHAADRDMSGLALVRREDGSTIVESVEAGTPAQGARLLHGDVILQVGDLDAAHHHILALRRALCREGHSVTIVVRRGGRTLDVPVALRDWRPDSSSAAAPVSIAMPGASKAPVEQSRKPFPTWFRR
jgi:hypothetical protein